CQLIKEIGILPLSAFIPDHPSLDTMTTKEQWHTGLNSDPWLWRTRFPGEKVAAYGKFMKKKSVLVSAEIFPLFKAVIGHEEAIEERYQAGLVTKAAIELHDAIKEEPGIETRALRARVGMKSKEMKKEFDNGLVELQSSADIVISGVKERLNDRGENNGWNSTSFELAEHWMTHNGIPLSNIPVSEAKEQLKSYLEKVCRPQALVFLNKTLKL
ncbi:MAG: hypothetical protein WD907_05465, partial [Bacilli bacterium]